MSDLISRQEAIKAVDDLPNCYNGFSDTYDKAYIIGVLEELPSAQPEPIRLWLDHELSKEEYERLKKDCAEQPIILLPKESAQQWIPCSERLPEESGRYLVTRGLNACGAMWNRVYIINYSDLMGLKSKRIWWDGNVGKSDFQKINDVIAWMPLPEPWRGEEHG